MASWLILGSCLIILTIICWLWLRFAIWPARERSRLARLERERERQAAASPRKCPVCGAGLLPGELVRSAVYPGKQERLTHIFGCPHCYPARPASKRACPVCGVRLPPNAYLVARMFERPGRKHVHVLGCSLCRKA
jgi:hypothetical protein